MAHSETAYYGKSEISNVQDSRFLGANMVLVIWILGI
jgi:hypothetical protein